MQTITMSDLKRCSREKLPPTKCCCCFCFVLFSYCQAYLRKHIYYCHFANKTPKRIKREIFSCSDNFQGDLRIASYCFVNCFADKTNTKGDKHHHQQQQQHAANHILFKNYATKRGNNGLHKKSSKILCGIFCI